MKHFTTRDLQIGALTLLLITLTSFSCNTEVWEITIRTKSRMYAKFKEDHTVKMYEKFPISDTDMEAVVVEFYPDFAIDTLSHKAISLSDTLRNPAAKVLIIQGNRKKEEAWAFPPGMIPHYSPRSFIGFELLDYKTSDKYIRLDENNTTNGTKNE